MAHNIPPPVWRFIEPTHPASTASANVFATMRQQIETSSQFWQVVQTPATGTNSLLLRCANPPAIPFFSGTSTTILTASEIYVLIANNITGNSAYREPDINTSNAARIQIGIAIGTGTFEGAQRDLPFDQPSGSIWSKYWVAGTLTILSQTFFLESSDIIAVGWRETNGNYAAICGAFLEGAYSCPYRHYGIVTNGSTAIPSNAWAVASNYFGHSASANAPHSGFFTLRAGAIFSFTTAAGIRASWDNISRNTNSVSATNFLTGSTRILEPVQVFSNSGSNEFIGFVRGMYITGDLRSLESITVGGIEHARILGNSRLTAADAIAVAPISGSTVAYGPPYAAG